jgi:acetyl-CoA decarbonylase/synthase complex subunit alpha
MKIASIFGRRILRGNYEEIADYTLNRIGACGVAWGAMSQKAASIATGCNRLGIPVIIGPQGSKYRRLYLGRREDEKSYEVIDARSGERSVAVAQPEHLIYAAESMEEALVLTAKLCLRASDTTKGRMIKLLHYTDLSKKVYGRLPEDLTLYIRTEADVPITFKDEIIEFLKRKDWHPAEKPSIDPTLLPRLVYGKGDA